MLNPRRANSPATRASTPGRFCTSTERMWCWKSCVMLRLRLPGSPPPTLGRRRARRRSTGRAPPSLRSGARRSSSVVVGSVAVASLVLGVFDAVVHREGSLAVHLAGVEDEVVVALAGGDHREDLLAGVDAELDDDGAVVDRVGLLDGRLDLLGRLDADADAAHRLGPHHVVGRVRRQVHLAVALVVEHLLPLADHAEVAVVEQADLDRDPLDRRRHQLLGRHLEAAVAVDGPHRAVGPADLGADRRRDREAHRAEAAGVDPRVRLGELPVLRRPHLVLADAGGEDRALAARRRAASPGRTAASGRRPARSARRSAGTARATRRCGCATPTCRPARCRRRGGP